MNLDELEDRLRCNGPRDCVGTERGCITCDPGGWAPIPCAEVLSLVERARAAEELYADLRAMHLYTSTPPDNEYAGSPLQGKVEMDLERWESLVRGAPG